MISRTKTILACLSALLGIVHIFYGLIVFESVNLQTMWFIGSGVAMIVTGLANFKTEKIWLLRIQNLLMTGFALSLTFYAPLPQVWLTLFLFAGLLAISFLNQKA